MKRIVLAALVAALSISTLAGCSLSPEMKKTASKFKGSDFSVAVIDTSASTASDSNVLFYDNQLTQLDKQSYAFASIGCAGQSLPQIHDNTIYIDAKGNSALADQRLILGLNLQNAEVSEFEISAPDITDFKLSSTGIYTIGNDQKSTYVNYISYDRKDAHSYAIKDIIATNLCVCQDEPYLFAKEYTLQTADSDEAEQKRTKKDGYSIYKIDPKANVCKELLNVSDFIDPSEAVSSEYATVYHNKIYYPAGSSLIVYDPVANKVTPLKMPCDDAFKMYRRNNILYLLDGNPDDPDTNATLYFYDLKKQEFKKHSYKIDHPADQIALTADGSFYTFSESDHTLRQFIRKGTDYEPCKELILPIEEKEHHLTKIFSPDELLTPVDRAS